jgi:hypothetical protein
VHSKKRTLILLGVLALLLAGGAALGIKLAVDAQRPKGTDAEQIQWMLYHAERAAERLQPAPLQKLIAKEYSDALGANGPRMRLEIMHYLRQQTSLEVEIPAEAIRIEVAPDGRTATAGFPIRVTTQGQGGSGRTDAVLSLSLVKEPVHYFFLFRGEEWRVKSVAGYAPGEE